MQKPEKYSWLKSIVAEALGLTKERAHRLLESRSTRILKYRDITYLTIRRDIGDHYEGTVILYSNKTGEYKVVEGYPHIPRVLLLGRAVPRHFIDNVIVEEKMDGHNVRVVRFEGEIYAITRGGYICPYTTARMRRKYGRSLEKIFDELGDDVVVAGEVVGMENPYTRYYYPEAPEWDYFVFDIFEGPLDFLSVEDRRAVVEEAGMRNVRLLGIVPKESWEEIAAIVKGLESLGREGIVMKDPLYRVDPLKYTTSYINARDIMEGMKYPFDEGHTFIFSRVLRQMFKAVEEGWDESRLRAEAHRIGEAILVPAVESLRAHMRGKPVAEQFTLTFFSREELDEYIVYMYTLGVLLSLVSIEELTDGRIRATFIKHKKTEDHFKRILRTGLSPLD